jgi:hypothetical protein
VGSGSAGGRARGSPPQTCEQRGSRPWWGRAVGTQTSVHLRGKAREKGGGLLRQGNQGRALRGDDLWAAPVNVIYLR